MIEAKETLIGHISAKQSLAGKLNNAIQYIEPTTQEKTITPTKEEQVVIPDDNIFALSKVTVEKIPDEYEIVEGSIDIVSNGTYDVTNYKEANVDVGGIVKGLRIDSYDSDGYVTSATIVGMTEIPKDFFSSVLSTNNLFKNIGENLFFPNNLKYIWNNGFAYCHAITKIEIPASVTIIGEGAFSYCSNLKKMIVKATKPPALGFACLNNTAIEKNTGYIYVPDESIDLYKSATNWASYADQIKGISELEG